MNSKQALAIIFFTLLVSSLAPIALTAGQEATPTPTPTPTPSPTPTPTPTPLPPEIAVTLLAPNHNDTIRNSFNVSFIYRPDINGTGHSIEAADLYINGTLKASNPTAIKPGENNTIYYKFADNGTCTWNIRIRNSTTVVSAPSDFNMTVAVYVAPEPTPTPTPKPTATPTPVPTAGPTITPHPTISPSSTPTPSEGLGTWTIVIIVIVVIGVVGAVAVILLRRSS